MPTPQWVRPDAAGCTVDASAVQTTLVWVDGRYQGPITRVLRRAPNWRVSQSLNLEQPIMNNRFSISRSHVRYRASWLMLFLTAGVLAQGCTTTRVSSDFDRSARFDGYHTYAWLPRAHASGRNPLIVRFARESIDAELAQKGFVLAADPSTADFEVDFTIGAHDRLDVSTYPARYRGPWGWGRGYYGDAIDVRQYREGTLAIDVFDGRTHQPVWTGRATKEITGADQSHSDGPIRIAAAAVLAQFPPPSVTELSKLE